METKEESQCKRSRTIVAEVNHQAPLLCSDNAVAETAKPRGKKGRLDEEEEQDQHKTSRVSLEGADRPWRSARLQKDVVGEESWDPLLFPWSVYA